MAIASQNVGTFRGSLFGVGPIQSSMLHLGVGPLFGEGAPVTPTGYASCYDVEWTCGPLSVFAGANGPLAWSIARTDGQLCDLPLSAAVTIYDVQGTLLSTIGVTFSSIGPAQVQDMEILYTFPTPGLFMARITILMPDATNLIDQTVVNVLGGWPTNIGGGNGNGNGNGGNGSGTTSGTVTSVGLVMPPEFAVANSPITISGVFAVTKQAQRAGTVWAGPETGADALPFFRELLLSDLPPVPPPDPSNIGNFLLSGGDVIWVSGYTYRVSAAQYYIQGVLYSSAEQVISLNAADPTLDRIDLLALNTSGALVKVTGAASVTPSEPDYDPATQLSLAFILVEALTSAPATSSDSIYSENVEWATSTSLTGWDPNSSSNPRSGVKCIEGTNVAAGAYVQFDRATQIDPNLYTYLVMYIRSKAAWASGRSLAVRFQSSGVVRGVTLTMGTTGYGFNASVTSGYQQVAFPIRLFAIPAGQMVNQLRIGDNGGSIGLYIDDIFLQQGASPVNGNWLTQDVADARYEQLAHKAAANGYAPLDASAKVPLINLPTIPASQPSLLRAYLLGGS